MSKPLVCLRLRFTCPTCAPDTGNLANLPPLSKPVGTLRGFSTEPRAGAYAQKGKAARRAAFPFFKPDARYQSALRARRSMSFVFPAGPFQPVQAGSSVNFHAQAQLLSVTSG